MECAWESSSSVMAVAASAPAAPLSDDLFLKFNERHRSPPSQSGCRRASSFPLLGLLAQPLPSRHNSSPQHPHHSNLHSSSTVSPLQLLHYRSNSESGLLNRLATRSLDSVNGHGAATTKPISIYSSAIATRPSTLHEELATDEDEDVASSSSSTSSSPSPSSSDVEDDFEQTGCSAQSRNIGTSASALDDDELCGHLDVTDPEVNETTVVETPKKARKQVRFSDDCGGELCAVRMMDASRPPQIADSIIDRWRVCRVAPSDTAAAAATKSLYPVPASYAGWTAPPAASSPTAQHRPTWRLAFAQPAALDFARFRAKLDSRKVALENARISADSSTVSLSIKVVNVSFEKHVFVRISTDQWRTHHDLTAVYKSSTHYDNFVADLPLPQGDGLTMTSRLEFCVGYLAGGNEYWDSNDGYNYALLCSGSSPSIDVGSPTVAGCSRGPLFGRRSIFFDETDCVLPTDSWRNYANHSAPYW